MTMASTTSTTITMLNTAIVDLECRLGLKPGQTLQNNNHKNTKKKQPHKNTNTKTKNKKQQQNPEELAAQPDICKLEFKVGVITKVWIHPNADKLYCEEIDVGEETGPRQIASGLRPHFSLEQMLGQRLLVVANLKAKNLVKFKSHGMVLCAAKMNDNGGGETVEFVEPPPEAQPGDVVSFLGLPPPIPLAPSQIEKKKIFAKCLDGLHTDAEGIATWNGHKFVVVGKREGSHGSGGSENHTANSYCRTKTICNGPMR